eukprot:256678_1
MIRISGTRLKSACFAFNKRFFSELVSVTNRPLVRASNSIRACEKYAEPLEIEEFGNYARATEDDHSTAYYYLISPPKPQVTEDQAKYEGIDSLALDFDTYFSSCDVNAVEDWNRLLRATAVRSTLEDTMALFKKMCGMDVKPDIDSYLAVLKSAVLNKQPDLGRDLIYDMGYRGINPTPKAYSYLIRASLSVNDPERAIQVMDIIKADGQRPVAEMYHALITYYGRNNQPKEAWTWFNNMQMEGCIWSPKVVAAIIDICASQRDSRRAMSLFDQFRFEGGEADLKIYNACIRACARSDHLDGGYSRAFSLFKEMKFRRIEPNIHTFNALLTATSENQEINMALQLIEMLETLELQKNRQTYTAMLRNISKTQSIWHISIAGRKVSTEERIQMAEEIIRELQENDISLTRSIVNAFFDCYCAASRVNRVMSFIESCESKYGFEPSAAMLKNGFRLMVKYREDHAVHLKSIMQSRGIDITENMLRALLRLACKRGNYKLGKDTIAEMSKHKFSVSEIDRLFVEACTGTREARARKYHEAKKKKAEMYAYRELPLAEVRRNQVLRKSRPRLGSREEKPFPRSAWKQAHEEIININK